ncbi:hypothetical protein SESBI_35864 [Sesbania bispinosa]|nr:hypothetical protein SESBI_35864 [Sesbania bispinosa]
MAQVRHFAYGGRYVSNDMAIYDGRGGCFGLFFPIVRDTPANLVSSLQRPLCASFDEFCRRREAAQFALGVAARTNDADAAFLVVVQACNASNSRRCSLRAVSSAVTVTVTQRRREEERGGTK